MGHGNKRSLYMKVFGILIVLTVLEVGVVYLIDGFALVSALILLALAKAACVALYFMHLADETKYLKWLVSIALLTFAPLYAFVLIAEAAFRHKLLGPWIQP